MRAEFLSSGAKMRKLFSFCIFFILFLSLFLANRSEAAIKRALLIGIGTYKNLPYCPGLGVCFNNLKGPRNDVRIMKEALVASYGFREEEVKTLIDAEATRENIINVFDTWLVQGTREGDLAFFFFSGHGTRVPDQNGDESDGYDEALCAYDMMRRARNATSANLIIDDEMGQMLGKLKMREVAVMVDSCHSGSMTRGINNLPVSDLEEVPTIQAKYVTTELEESSLRRKGLSSRDIPIQNDIPGGQIFISASRENQIAVEMSLPQGVHGALTVAFVEGMKNKKGATYGDLYEYAKKVMKDRYRLSQDPQIEPQRGKLVQNEAFTLTYTVVSQVKPQVQKPEAEKPEPPVSLAPSVSPPVPPKEKPEGTKPPGLKPEASAPVGGPAKPEPTVTAGIPPKPQPPQEPTKPQTLPSAQPVSPPVPPQPDKPSSAPQPPADITTDKVLVRVEPLQGADAKIRKQMETALKKLPYLRLVEDDTFDRFIRGEVKEGEYHIRILNRIGDVIRIPKSKDLNEVVRVIAPHLEYACIVKQLAHVSHPNPPFKINLSVQGDRRDFKLGEKIVYTVECEEDCYLLMLNLDSKGDVHVIFPNLFSKSNFVKAGIKVQLPDAEMRKRKFEFQFFPPSGEETVKVIATNKELKLQALNLAKFKEAFKRIPGSPLQKSSPSRALTEEVVKVLQDRSKEESFRWSEDAVVVRSY